MKNTLTLILMLVIACCTALTAAPQRFLGVDESRGQLIYVDTADASKSWALSLPVKCRDIQLIGKQRVLLSGSNGYYEYDLASRSCIKTFSKPDYAGTISVRRTPEGRTLIGCIQQGNTVIYELGANEELLRQALFSGRKSLRLMRVTRDDTLLFGGPDNTIVEADMSGVIRREIVIPGGRHVYQALRLPGGSTVVASGYGSAVIEFAADGKELRRFAASADDKARGVNTQFFAGMQILPDGTVVVCNWTGHRPEDSQKGPQLLQFDQDGKLVWTWHDPAFAGTLHGVIVLDHLNADVLCDDSNGVLAPR